MNEFDSTLPLDEIDLLSGRIAIYGGTFDPVQLAHLEVAKRALASFKLDAIIFIPTNQNPLKESAPTASYQHRLKMLLIATASEKNFYVSDLERSKEQEPSYTIHTVEYFRSKLKPECELFFLTGSDTLPNLSRWYLLDRLFELLDGCLVVERDDFCLDNLSKSSLPDRILKKIIREPTKQATNPISATKVRELLSTNRAKAKSFLPVEVFDYIKGQDLYI